MEEREGMEVVIRATGTRAVITAATATVVMEAAMVPTSLPFYFKQKRTFSFIIIIF